MRASILVLGVLAAVTFGPVPTNARAPVTLTDAEIAHVAVTANAIDVELAKLAETPADNAVSASLRPAADPVHRALIDLHGTTFDLAYVEREAAYHRAVLDALDQVLIPQMRSSELRALLERVRPVIAAHLECAQRLDQGSDAHR